ncbi:hypothetical protein H0H92_003986 [Tricholoma furcatifolium]|nr:hypothetical protein H0H92_003986 [Tricholoma furcatifolium]
MINASSEDTGALYSSAYGDPNKVPSDSQLTRALKPQASPAQPVDVFDKEQGFGRLLAWRKALTQTAFDIILQYSKDTKLLPTTSESNLIVVLQQLAKETGGLPARFDLAGVTVSFVATASGGSADIYQGYVQGKDVCVKKIRCAKHNLDKVSKNILDEAILCDYLSAHPNILPFLGVHREGNIQSLVYLWMENGDLVSYLKRYPDADRLQLFLHERLIVHGDLKGINVLVNDSGRACIADFGLSSIVPSRGGTPYCQAPELFKGKYNTKATDIYAFGCLVYEVFAGKQPFAGIFNPSLIASKVLQGHRPKRPSASSLSWTAWGLTNEIWDKLIKACWKENPMERPTIDAVIQSLEQALRKRNLDDGFSQLGDN